MNNRLAFILGIRPDVIRASLIIKHLRRYADCELHLIWSGQHYSDNLKGIFFRELDVVPAEIDLACGGETDAHIAASVISGLYPVLRDLDPAAAVFLGDNNTTLGAIAAAQLNVPVVHIEGCMRSYDWRMPEEKYRTTIDHLADVIYAYVDEYKTQGIREGLNPANIVVVGNPIVDVLEHYYFSRLSRYEAMMTDAFFADRGVRRGEYYLMTCHRRENVEQRGTLEAILRLVEEAPHRVYFPASYRTQQRLRDFGLALPPNVNVVDPIGYEEMLCLMVGSRGVLTDSGTVVEEACVLQVPSVQMRRATERPQVYDARSSVKFDPAEPESYPSPTVFRKLESLVGTRWTHNLGDGRASERIAEDLHRRLATGDLSRHRPEHYHVPIDRSYRGDGLDT
ncbi:MAG: UDP-N-acetyl glucosamine 2-epimerase [Deltaproteobacteria bacterium]|nr:MAG: UDP-N-acetyl glucosamine 2-epimerase [Deltaproteobacteria bacterium]